MLYIRDRIHLINIDFSLRHGVDIEGIRRRRDYTNGLGGIKNKELGLVSKVALKIIPLLHLVFFGVIL